MGLIAPNMLDVGDVAQLAGLVAPRPLLIAQGIEPEGEIASKVRLRESFAFTQSVYSLLGVPEKLALGRAYRSSRLARSVLRSGPQLWRRSSARHFTVDKPRPMAITSN